jgi:hypothetical protein
VFDDAFEEGAEGFVFLFQGAAFGLRLLHAQHEVMPALLDFLQGREGCGAILGL